MPQPRASLLPNSSLSKLKPPQSAAAPRAPLPVRASGLAAPRVTPAQAVAPVSDELNATVVVDKPTTTTQPAVLSGIPRPALTKIPMPRSAVK